MGYLVWALIILIVVCLLFAISAGFVRQSLVDSEYNNNCNATATNNLNSAWNRINAQFGICIAFGLLAVIGLIVYFVKKNK